MDRIERWVLRCADWDGTWWGLGWLRPAKTQRINLARLVGTSLVLSLPGIAAGLGLIYLVLDTMDPVVAFTLGGIVIALQLGLHAPWAYFWNRRAAALQGSST